MFCRPATKIALLAAALPAAVFAQSAALPGPETPDPSLEHQRQQQRTELLRQQFERGEDVRRPAAAEVESTTLPTGEQPCFRIDTVRLSGADAALFPGLSGALAGAGGHDTPEGRCLGAQGIKLLLKRLQHELIARGYLTSRVAVPSQDLNSGTLEIAVQAGRVEQLRFDGEGGTSLAAAMPIERGQVLNLRDVEQGLENLKRVPSAEADIEIQPSDTAGASDLVVRYQAANPLRVTVAADDGGLKATGKYQGSVTIAYDNPLGLNDLAYAALSHDLMADGAERGTWGLLTHYSVPFGYWSAALTFSRNRDRQTVRGATTEYVYGGYSNVAELELTRIVHRDGSSKTALSAGAWRRSSHNFIDDTEVEVQHRQTGGWQLSANHRHFIGAATLDATLGYKRGTGAFGSIAAPEELFGEGSSRFRKSTADLRLDLPLGSRLAYAGVLRAQWNHSRLNPQEMFVIGGRYTVRGFDGETVLAAERGWLLRNELSTPLPGLGSQAYLGLDHGRVDGPTSERLAGTELTGIAIGVRGGWRGAVFDLFVGAPLAKPSRFDAPARTAGFRLAYTL